jgi:hypothetical protein
MKFVEMADKRRYIIKLMFLLIITVNIDPPCNGFLLIQRLSTLQKPLTTTGEVTDESYSV